MGRYRIQDIICNLDGSPSPLTTLQKFDQTPCYGVFSSDAVTIETKAGCGHVAQSSWRPLQMGWSETGSLRVFEDSDAACATFVYCSPNGTRFHQTSIIIRELGVSM